MGSETQEILRLVSKINSKALEIAENKVRRDKLIYNKVRGYWDRQINEKEALLDKMLDELEITMQPRRVSQDQKMRRSAAQRVVLGHKINALKTAIC